jgi:hypothetical protein
MRDIAPSSSNMLGFLKRKGRTMPTTSNLGQCVFVLVAFFLAASGAAIADISDSHPPKWRVFARQFYEGFESQARNYCTEKINSEIKLLKSYDATIDDSSFKIVFRAALVTTYQDLIDRMACLEQQFESNDTNGPDNVPFQARLRDSSSCYEKRAKSSEEMLEWIGTYGKKFQDNMNTCVIKTRLLSLESKYPPYEFMGSSDDNGLLAVDSREFLTCVKSRL